MRCGVLGIVGFILSVIFILLSLVVLVRFWIFDNIAYNIFVLSMLIIGILFNITSINLTFSELTVSGSEIYERQFSMIMFIYF